MSSTKSAPNVTTLTSASSLRAADLFSVQNQTVLITGGGRGIGFMIAQAFISNGAHVIIASRNQKQLEQATQQLLQLAPGSKCTAIVVDFSTVSAIETFVSELTSVHQVTSLHTLINNSGLAWGEPLSSFSEKGWDSVMNVNLKSVFFLTKLLLPLLSSTAQQTGSPSKIINIGSVAGLRHQVQPTYSYDVSKAALHHLTKKLALDLAGKNITVNAIAPGYFPSKMSNQLRLSREVLSQNIPLGRVGAVEDIAGVSLLLASKAGDWISGAIIPVDGAQTTTVQTMQKSKL